VTDRDAEGARVADDGGTPPLVDLHCHLLPGVDDGSRTPAQSAEVVGKFWDDGVRGLCLTPHVPLSDSYGAPRATLVARFAAAYEQLRAATAESPMRYWSGAEVMVEEPPQARHDLTAPLTLGDSNALLIEFPTFIGEHAILRTVGALRDRAIVPLIAHPERYDCCSPENVTTWRDAGAWIQADATSAMFDAHGRGERARALLRLGLVDLLAGDNHGDDRSLARAYHHMVAAGHADAAAQLCSAGPRALLHDAPRLEPVLVELERPAERHSILDRLRHLWRRW
jgi:protein-tyrosine phosphatase